MPTPLNKILRMRRDAIGRLFATKFGALTRIQVGSATGENAAGAGAVYERLTQLLNKHPSKDIVVGRVGCAGRCDLEPLVTVIRRGQIPVKYVKMTPARMERVFESHILGGKSVEEYTMAHQAALPRAKRVVSVCTGASCVSRNMAIEQALLTAVKKNGLETEVAITRSACQGLCERGPILFTYPDAVTYQKVTPEIAEEIVVRHLKGGNPLAQHVWAGRRLANLFLPLYGDVHFFGKQLRLTLRNCGVIDPENLDEYLAVQGYEALARTLTELKPKEVIDMVLRSGLRGRGGGFSTGLKWQMAAAQRGAQKYFICNADEGDPGAFMDRSTIEGDPQSILEGIMIGGYAIGANKGFVYIRAEYPLAIARLKKQSPRRAKRGCWGRIFWGPDLISISNCGSAPARSSVGKRPRSSAPSKMSGVCRAPGHPIPPQPVYGAVQAGSARTRALPRPYWNTIPRRMFSARSKIPICT